MTQSTKDQFPLQSRLIFIAGLVAFLWAVEIIDWLVFDGDLDRYGVHPRSVDGLTGIAFQPFLHGGFRHLMANTIPLLVLGTLLILRGFGEFITVSVLVIIIGGLGVWLVGSSNSIHIGASGLIFGYFGFLLLIGLLESRLKSILVSVLVGVVYGGLIWGVLPSQPHVSWEGHLFGFIGGLLTAWLMTRGKRPKKAAAAA